MLRRLDRYVLGEVVGPLGLGFVVYTMILILQFLFKSADMIIRQGVPAEIVGKLLLVTLPNIVVLTIPMAYLFGILLAVGRLSADSELVALRSCGISLFSLYRPILALSALLAAFNLYLMLEALPRGNQALLELKADILRQSLSQQVEPRTFFRGWEDKSLYVFEMPPGDDRWRGVFLADSLPSSTENDVLVAAWGRAATTADGTEVRLLLDEAYHHQMNFAEPRDYHTSFSQEHEQTLVALDAGLQATSVSRSLQSLPLGELRRRSEDPTASAGFRNLAAVEIHKRFGIPAACVVLGLLGLPLGFTSSRGGRSSGFALSIGVFLVYYVLLNWGQELAREGDIPAWLAVWFPNIVLLGVGLVLLARRNRDKSLALARVQRWAEERIWARWSAMRARRRRQRQEARAGPEGARRRRRTDLVLRLPELRLRRPTLVDRYLLSIFLRVLLIVTLAGLAIHVVADLTENVDEILEYQVPWGVVVEYYKFKSFDILHQNAPITVLVTTLVAFGLLSRTNEVTACKALGIGLYRLALPILFAAGVLAAVSGLLQSEILPAANERVGQLHSIIRGQADDTPYLRADQRWKLGRNRYLYNYLHYDPIQQTLHRLQVFHFDAHYRLRRRLLVHRAAYLGSGEWRFSGGWSRSFEGATTVSYEEIEKPVRSRLPERPEFFTDAVRRPAEMTYGELRSYLDELGETGQRDPVLEVELHKKVAYPMNTLVMALVALPFAFRMGRRGALYGIGLSLALGIVFLALVALFTAFGEAARLPPVVGVWAPGLIFSVFSLYLFLGVRT